MKVLFVQENSFLATALQLTMITRGYDLVVSDGDIPASRAMTQYHPNIVIADITQGTGFSYVKEAKKNNVPVLVISKSGREDDLQKAFDIGADDYVNMPISFNELALRVNLLTKEAAA